MPEPLAIDYKTHILIGVRANGVMTVIADWPHLPRQATQPATATQRSSCAPRRPSYRRTATGM